MRSWTFAVIAIAAAGVFSFSNSMIVGPPPMPPLGPVSIDTFQRDGLDRDKEQARRWEAAMRNQRLLEEKYEADVVAWRKADDRNGGGDHEYLAVRAASFIVFILALLGLAKRTVEQLAK